MSKKGLPIHDCVGSHGITDKMLSAIVLDDFNRVSTYIIEHEEEFAKLLQDQFELDNSKAVKQVKIATEKAELREAELDTIIQKLYEDNVTGKVSDDRFSKLSDNYESEQRELRQFIREARIRIDKQTKQSRDILQFIEIVKKYFEPKELSPEMVRELFEKIELGPIERVNGKRQQIVKLHYRFVDELTNLIKY